MNLNLNARMARHPRVRPVFVPPPRLARCLLLPISGAKYVNLIHLNKTREVMCFGRNAWGRNICPTGLSAILPPVTLRPASREIWIIDEKRSRAWSVTHHPTEVQAFLLRLLALDGTDREFLDYKTQQGITHLPEARGKLKSHMRQLVRWKLKRTHEILQRNRQPFGV